MDHLLLITIPPLTCVMTNNVMENSSRTKPPGKCLQVLMKRIGTNLARLSCREGRLSSLLKCKRQQKLLPLTTCSLVRWKRTKMTTCSMLVSRRNLWKLLHAREPLRPSQSTLACLILETIIKATLSSFLGRSWMVATRSKPTLEEVCLHQ